jgi:hypothetical protein
MNILYIGENIQTTKTGGDVINKRNIDVLRRITNNIYFIEPIRRNNILSIIKDALRGYAGFLTPKIKTHVCETVKNSNIDIVFLSSSRIGRLSRDIKKIKPNIKIITFAHNVEKHYTQEELEIKKSLKNYMAAIVLPYNEKIATQYSDYIIVLNQRDKNLLLKLYNRDANLILPTSFNDLYDKNYIITKSELEPIQFLFVGSNFFPNIYGIKWFVKNVLPHISGNLTIVGKDMQKLDINSERVQIIDYVEDLSTYYYHADIVISPIFHGAGMKTKTAEALMYGKPILGTKEAFEGYDLDYKKVGGLFSTAEEMISLINHLKGKDLDQMGKYARKIFEGKYSIETTHLQMKVFFQNIFPSCTIQI